MSGGRFIIDHRGGNAIVPGWEEAAAAEKGILDFGVTASIVYIEEFGQGVSLFNTRMGSQFVPLKMIAWNWLYGIDLFNELLSGKNVIAVAGWEGTPEMFLNTTKELRTVDDIKGLKIRTAGVDATLFAEMGASTVSMPPPDIYEGMQRGVIDAFQLNAPAIDYAVSLYEVVDYTYVSPVRQPAEYHHYFVNKGSWAELPDDLKAIFQAAVLEESYVYLAETIRDDAEAIQFYIDYGVTVGPPPRVIEEALIERADAFYDALAAEDPWTDRILKSQREFEASYDATYPSPGLG